MCGRYYVDYEMINEMEKLVGSINEKFKQKLSGDVYPSQYAVVMTGKRSRYGYQLQEMRWGFPQYQKKGLLMNSRVFS